MKDPDSPDALIRLIRGSAEAFDELYDLMAPKLRRFVRWRYGQRGISYSDAEEITNDALCAVHKAILKFDPRLGGSLKTLIYIEARRKAIDLWRQRSRKKKRDAIDSTQFGDILPLEDLTYEDYPLQAKSPLPDFAREVEDTDRELLWKSLEILSERERVILLCSRDRAMTDKELAQHFNVTDNHVRQLRLRAAKKARREFERLKSQ